MAAYVERIACWSRGALFPLLSEGTHRPSFRRIQRWGRFREWIAWVLFTGASLQIDILEKAEGPGSGVERKVTCKLPSPALLRGTL